MPFLTVRWAMRWSECGAGHGAALGASPQDPRAWLCAARYLLSMMSPSPWA